MNLTNLFIQDILKNFPNSFFWYREDAKKAKPIPFPSNVINDRDNTINWSMIKAKDEKYAISFTPNGDFYYHQNSRTLTNAGRIYAIAIDCDEGDKKWENFPIEPSIVVQTKRGEHVYWLLKTPVQYSSTAKDYARIMDTLSITYGADPQAKDITRLFRLPGSTHKKDMDDIFSVECVKYNPELKYTIEDFLEYCDVEKGDIKTISPSYYSIVQKDREIFNDIHEVNAVDVLSHFVDIEEERGNLALGGKRTGGYKYWKEKNIIKAFSGDKGGIRPTGGPFGIARSFLKNNADVFKFFEEKYGIKKKTKLAVAKVVSKNEEIEKKIEEDILTGNVKDVKEIDVSALILSNDISQLGSEQISVSMEHQIGKDDYKFSYDDELVLSNNDVIVDGFFTCIGTYENNGIMHYVLYAKKNGVTMTKVVDRLHSSSRLEYWLSYMGLTFNGTKNSAKGLISIIHKTHNKMTYINKAGIYPNGLIVCKRGEYILLHDGHYYYCNIDNSSSGRDGNQSDYMFTPGINRKKDYFMDVVKRVCDCHNPNITYPLFVIYSMGMMSHILKDIGVKVPGALVYGNPGSGKSETILNIQKILGIPSLNIQGDSSKFSFDYIAKHYLPIKIAEYDRVKQKFDVDTFLKNSYDGETATRGTKEQSIIAYENNALFIVDGENRSMNPAVYSRNFAFHFTSKDLKERTPQYQKMILDGYLKQNVTGYLINKKDDLLKFNFRERQAFHKDEMTIRTESYDIQEKGRMLNNYGTTIAYIEAMDMMEFKEYIDNAFISQLDMFGDSKIDKTIKQFCMKALFDRVTIMLNNEYLEIPAYIDSFRSDINRADDAQGNIMVANSILAPEFAKNNTDTLYVPHTYMQGKKNLHSIYNNILNSVSKYVDFGPDSVNVVNSIRKYADENGFKNQPFYDDVTLRTG